VKEQSHKRDMAAALRGDFARLRARGVSTTIELPAELEPDRADETMSPVAEPEPPIPEPERRSLLRIFRGP
jgi:hypothetical protein